MAKMNIATFLIGTNSHKLNCDFGEAEQGVIIDQMIGSWEDRRYLYPLPRHETKRSVNHFSSEYNWGFRKN